jgi:DNA-directed RNA polymerase subunit A"
MTIRLTEEYAKNRNKAREIANRIEATYILDIADIATDIRNLVIEITPDERVLKRKQLTIEEIKKKIEKALKVEVVEEDGKLIVKPEPSYKALMDTFEKLKKLVLAGIKEIRRVIIRKEGEEYVLYTEGSNLKKVMKVKGVDFTRTTTNNIYEIYEVLGIEAARNAVIKEAISTLEEQGLEVDIRHIMLVADAMTSDGELKQIGRHGVAGEKQSILARAAFEMTVNNLLDAAVRGDIDSLSGITENIIVGQPIKLGTGDVELVTRFRRK